MIDLLVNCFKIVMNQKFSPVDFIIIILHVFILRKRFLLVCHVPYVTGYVNDM